jgi:putative addiction module component (TIGR02574 family)
VDVKSITLDEVLQLPVPERIRVVEAIWDSIAETPEALELTDEQRAELDRRLDSLEKKPTAGSSWAEVRDRIWRGT